MEYLLVKFPEARRVILNGVDTGQDTDQVIEMEAGHHTVTLSGSADYTPDEQIIVLQDTSALDPMEVRFEKI
jgi:hypothetical protein